MAQAWGLSYEGSVSGGQLAEIACQCIVTLLVKSSLCMIKWQPKHPTLTTLLTLACITTQICLMGGIWNKTTFPTKPLKHHGFREMILPCTVLLCWACGLSLSRFSSLFELVRFIWRCPWKPCVVDNKCKVAVDHGLCEVNVSSGLLSLWKSSLWPKVCLYPPPCLSLFLFVNQKYIRWTSLGATQGCLKLLMSGEEGTELACEIFKGQLWTMWICTMQAAPGKGMWGYCSHSSLSRYLSFRNYAVEDFGWEGTSGRRK